MRFIRKVFNVTLVSAALAVGASLVGPVAEGASGPVRGVPPAVAYGGTKTSVHVCPGPTQPGTARCHALVRTDVGAKPAATGGPAGYGPFDLQSAYQLPSSTAGSGAVVAIVDAYDDPSAESDLGVYRSQYSLPPCTTANGCFRKVNENGAASPLPSASGSWSQEISLDLDMVSAICPNCGILLVEANSNKLTDLGTAVNTAASMGAKAISNSYGGSEFSSEATYESAYYDHPGIAVTASSGDNGYGVEFPAASRYVTAAGGTTLTPASNTRGWSETVWSGAGSGCSAYVSKPSWQTDPLCSNRTVADVAAVADPNTGVSVYDSYAYQGMSGWLVFGGTSVASPITASTYALAGDTSTTDWYASYPYGSASALFEVVSGSNGSCGNYLCNAAYSYNGYNGPTGLGTPDSVTAFRPAAATADFSISASPSSNSVAPGGSTSYTVSLTSTNGYNSSVNLAVTAGLPAGASASFNPNPLIPGNTAVTSTLTVTTTSSTPAGSYQLTITGTGSDAASTTHSTTVTLVVATPDFTMSISPSSQTIKGAGSASYSVTLTAVSGYSASVTLSASGLPSATSATFSPNPVTPTGSGATSTMTLSTGATTPAGTYTIAVTGAGSDGTTHSTTATLVVNGDFNLALASGSLTVNRGSSGSDVVTLTTADAYNLAVSLSASGLPNRAKASFSPNPVTPTSSGATSTLTVTASRNTHVGTYTVTVTGKGTDGTTHSVPLTLTIN